MSGPVRLWASAVCYGASSLCALVAAAHQAAGLAVAAFTVLAVAHAALAVIAALEARDA